MAKTTEYPRSCLARCPHMRGWKKTGSAHRVISGNRDRCRTDRRGRLTDGPKQDLLLLLSAQEMQVNSIDRRQIITIHETISFGEEYQSIKCKRKIFQRVRGNPLRRECKENPVPCFDVVFTVTSR